MTRPVTGRTARPAARWRRPAARAFRAPAAAPAAARALAPIIAAVVALIVSALASGGAARADQVSTFMLDNGLEVVVIEDHRAPVAVQMIWYRIGAADEAPGKSGIAHFLEHLMFKGTATVGPSEFSARVAAQGGNDNAFTSWDYTAYYQRIASDRLGMVMALEADRMRNLRLTGDDVRTEREVVLEERAQRTDSDPGALLGERMRAVLFLNSPYRLPIIGWKSEIAALSRDDALAWYSRYYAPNNAILVLAGDVTPERARALAEEHYGPIAPSGGIVPRSRPQEPPPLAPRKVTLSDARVSQPALRRLYLAPARRPGDQKTGAALAVLASLLGGDGQTSVLAREMQFDAPTAVYTAAYYDGVAIDSGTFGIVVVPAPGVGLAAAEAALDRALAGFLRDGPDPAAFARVKTLTRAGEIYQKDDVQELGNMYGRELVTGLSVQDVQDYPAIIDALTIDDVRAAARLVLDPRASVTGWLLPAEAEGPDTAGGRDDPGAATGAEAAP